MARRSGHQPTGITRGKLILVVVLAAILAAVLAFQPGGDTDEGQPKLEIRARADLPAAASKTANDAASKQQTEQPRPPLPPWPRIGSAEVLGYNPFEIPKQLHQPSPPATATAGGAETPGQSAAERQAADSLRTLEELRAEGVSIVFRSGGELVARIGSRTVRVDDVVDGFRVVAIGPDGVVLEQEPTP